MISDYCLNTDFAKKRRQVFHQRKLEMLIFLRDSLERRISSVNASIDTLKEQIKRDQPISQQ